MPPICLRPFIALRASEALARKQSFVQLSRMVDQLKGRTTYCGPIVAMAIIALLVGGYVAFAWLSPDA